MMLLNDLWGIEPHKSFRNAEDSVPYYLIAKPKFEISPEKTAEVSVIPYDEFKNSYKLNNLALKDTFDFDKIQGNAVFRSRTEGDKADIHGGTKTLKKLFIEEKIPAEKRSSVAVAADEEGVLWIEGLGAARRARLSEKTVNVAVIKIRVEK